MTSKNTGFTLIELIIVVIIIGILATIAAPMMSGLQEKAIRTEAIAALGTIRTAQRAYRVEYGNYVTVRNFCIPNPLISPGALNGTYFSENCYMIGDVDGELLDAYRATNDHVLLDLYLSEVGSTTGLIVCYSSKSTAPAPRADKAINLKNFYMSQTNGYIFETDARII